MMARIRPDRSDLTCVDMNPPNTADIVPRVAIAVESNQ
jgi:hypothetical protein